MATAPYSPDNPLHVKSRKRRAKLDAMREQEAFRWVMGDPRGRLVISAMLDGADIGKSPFSRDALRMSYDCGRQAEAQKLIDKIKDLCPRDFLKMETERLLEAEEIGNKDLAGRTTSEPDETGNGEGD